MLHGLFTIGINGKTSGGLITSAASNCVVGGLGMLNEGGSGSAWVQSSKKRNFSTITTCLHTTLLAWTRYTFDINGLLVSLTERMRLEIVQANLSSVDDLLSCILH